MPGCRMIEVWIGADLKWVLAQPEELFIHSLSPEVGVPDPRGDNDRDQNGSGDCDPRLPPLRRGLPLRWQWRNFRQHRQWRSFDQVRLAADAIVQEFHPYSKHERQCQTCAQRCKREFEAV